MKAYKRSDNQDYQYELNPKKWTPSCCKECPSVEKCGETDCPEWWGWFTRTWKEIQKLVKEDGHEKQRENKENDK